MSGLVCSPFENITQTHYPNYGVDITKTKLAIETNNLCGKDYYIKRHDDNCLVGCTKCPENISPNSAMSDMCSNDPDIWIQAHLDANISGTPHNRWKEINTVLSTNNTDLSDGEIKSALETAKEWYINRMDDNELRSNMQRLKWGENISEDERLNEFKKTISYGRGSSISCIEPNESNSVELYGVELFNLGSDWSADDHIGPRKKGNKRWEGCDDSSMFGPKNIIQDELLEWSTEYDRQTGGNTASQLELGSGQMDEETLYGDMTKGIMGLELFPPNREFEDCINGLLNEYDDYNDSAIISEIRDVKNILELEEKHIQFIKKKLELLIISSSKIKVKQCMLGLDLPCDMSLSFKMLTILNILFSTIGFNLDLDVANSEDDDTRAKLTGIIDELGDLIPRSLDKIIEISEDIEYNKCGKVSGKTELLKHMKDSLFNPPKKSINLELPDLKNFLSDEYMSDNEFYRFAVLAGIGLAVFKFI